MDTKVKPVSVADIRAVISRFRAQAVIKQKSGEHYLLDRKNAQLYLDGHDAMANKVYEFLHTLKERGEPIVYVDVCGRAKLDYADTNYSFSLQENYFQFEHTPERVVGDLFSARDFYGFLQTIKANGHLLSLVTCEPVAGLDSYTTWFHKKSGHTWYREVLFQRLSNNLRATIRLLRPGGFIYLANVLQVESVDEFFAKTPQENYRWSLFLKELCASMYCSLDIESTGYGPVFLIRKLFR
jgi:hypothetical protein